MHMQHLPLSIEPCSAFATPLKGDTLFGQLCWALRDRLGEHRLRELLEGYTEGRPFAVVSDALPEGCWPRPVVPPAIFGDVNPAKRKTMKKRTWLRHEDFVRPVREWLRCMVEDPHDAGDDPASAAPSATEWHPLVKHETTRFRNSTRPPRRNDDGRRLRTLRDVAIPLSGGSAPRLHVVYDAERIDEGALLQAMIDIGEFGFGRDATRRSRAFHGREMRVRRQSRSSALTRRARPPG